MDASVGVTVTSATGRTKAGRNRIKADSHVEGWPRRVDARGQLERGRRARDVFVISLKLCTALANYNPPVYFPGGSRSIYQRTRRCYFADFSGGERVFSDSRIICWRSQRWRWDLHNVRVRWRHLLIDTNLTGARNHGLVCLKTGLRGARVYIQVPILTERGEGGGGCVHIFSFSQLVA